MNIQKVFKQSEILETAMQASQYKNKVILNNIANADTPNYKSKNVEFKSILKDAIENENLTQNLNNNNVMDKIHSNSNKFRNRLDGNSVDIETEMVEFYKNSLDYDVIVNSVLSNSNIKNNVLNIFK